MAEKSDIRIRLWAPPGHLPSSIVIATTDEESAWLRKLMDQGGIAHVFRTGGFRGLYIALNLFSKLRKAFLRHADVDIVHVNWLQNTVPLWGSTKPAVISVLGSDYGFLRLPGMVPVLRKIIKQRRCIISPNAEWMVPELEDCFGDIAEIRCIPFGVREMWFTLRRRNPNPLEPRKWIVVSRLTKKKIGPLFSWGEKLFEDKDELHLLGPMQEQMIVPGWIHYHGPTHPADLHDRWFPGAAGLITLSEHDEGRPQIILEAMAAGLPVIASDNPAHRNILEHGKTGWIVKKKEDFQKGLTLLRSVEVNTRIGRSASEWVLRHIGTWDKCAARYVAAYEKLMEVN